MAKGPAPKGEYFGKSSVFSTRIRPDLRKKLDAAATKSGRSVSQEVEHRLRQTFIDEDQIADRFGDRLTYSLMRMMALAIHLPTSVAKPSRWLQDPEQFEIAVSAALNVLEAVRPNGVVDASVLHQRHLQTQGQKSAFRVWRAVKRADPALALDKGTREDHLSGRLKDGLDGLADIALEDGDWLGPTSRGK
jgi:hypothetical protein